MKQKPAPGYLFTKLRSKNLCVIVSAICLSSSASFSAKNDEGSPSVSRNNLSRCLITLEELGAFSPQLSEFPVGHVRTTGLGGWEQSERVRQETVATFNEGLMRKIPGYRWYSLKEVSGGLGKSLAPKDLNGRMVVGIDYGTEGITTYQGHILETEVVSTNAPTYRVKVRTREGDIEVVYSDRDVLEFGSRDRLYLLGEEISSSDAFLGAMEAADFRKIISESFGDPPTAEDFDIAIAATRLFLDLPASHGVSSVVKTLRGKSEATKQRPEFGLVAGNRRYSDKKLENFTRKLSQFLAGQRQMIEEEPAAESGAPDWLRLRKISDRAGLAIEHLQSLKTSSSGGESTSPNVRTTAMKPKVAGDFNKVAQAELRESPILNRAKELREILGLQYERSRLTTRKAGIARISTKKDPKAGTTTIKFKFEDAAVEAGGGLNEQGARVWEAFVPVAELTFDTATAKPVGKPKYFWSRQKFSFSKGDEVFELIPAPELDPEYKDPILASAFNKGVPQDIQQQRRRQVEAELLVNDKLTSIINAKKQELRRQFAGRNLWERGSVGANEERNLSFSRTEQRGSEVREVYLVDQFHLVPDRSGKRYKLEVVVSRSGVGGPISGSAEFRWVEEPYF